MTEEEGPQPIHCIILNQIL